MAVSDVVENGNVIIQLTYVSEFDATTLHAHIVQLPQHGRLCQLVNVSQCGEVMYPSSPTNFSTSESVDVVVLDPDFSVVYVPEENWSGVDFFTWEMQDSFSLSKNQANVTITVKHVSEPPTPFDMEIPLTVTSDVLTITLNATDPDQDSATLIYTLDTLPLIGTLSQSYWNASHPVLNELVQLNVPLRNRTLLYNQANMASSNPFSNFTFAVTDSANFTRKATVSFSVTCPPGLVNNIFLTVGPLCIDCPVGAECSQSGSYSPFTQTGYWPSDLNTPKSAVYLTCLPSTACQGGPWGASPDSLCTAGYTDRRCGTCADGFYKLNGACSSCPSTGSFWLTVMVYVLPTSGILGLLLLLISKLRLEVTFFTIAVNFFQLLATFSQFQLDWPSPTHTFFSSVSFINFNVDLLSLECHFPGITYQEKWLACILFPAVIAVLMVIFSYASAALMAVFYWLTPPKAAEPTLLSPRPRPSVLSPPSPPKTFSGLLSRQLQVHHTRFIWAYQTFLVVVFLSLALKSFEMLKCTSLPDGTTALDVEPSIRCDVPSYVMWQNLAIVSVCLYVIGIPLWLSYVMFRLRPPVNADAVCGGLLYVPRSSRRRLNLRRQKRRAGDVGGAEEYRLSQELELWSGKYSTLTKPFSDQYYYWAICILVRNLIVAIVSIVCTTIPLYQACLTLLTLAMAVLFQQFLHPYRAHTGMNELELSSLSCAILILFLGILFYAQLGVDATPSNVLAWLTLGLVFIFSCVTLTLFVIQLRRSWRTRPQALQKEEPSTVDLALLQRMVKVKTLSMNMPPHTKEQGLVMYKRKLPSDSTIELASIDRSQRRGKEEVTQEYTTDEGSLSAGGGRVELKQVSSQSDLEMGALNISTIARGEEKKGDSEPLPVSPSHTPPTHSEDSDSSPADSEDSHVEGPKKGSAIVQRVQIITSPFPAPLPIFHPLVHSDSKQLLTLARADMSEKKEGGSDDDSQVFLIDHSHISSSPLTAAKHFRPPISHRDADLRHDRAAGRWTAAITAVVLHMREQKRSVPHHRQEMIVIRGSVAGSTSPPPPPTFTGDAPEPVFLLKKRTGGAKAEAQATTSSGGAASQAMLRPMSPRLHRRTSQLLRRPSISLSSSLAPMDSVQSEVSVLSLASSDSAPPSPISRSQSHFVIPPAALRHETPAYYHSVHRTDAPTPPQQGVTLLISDELARNLSASVSGSSEGSSQSGGTEVSQ